MLETPTSASAACIRSLYGDPLSAAPAEVAESTPATDPLSCASRHCQEKSKKGLFAVSCGRTPVRHQESEELLHLVPTLSRARSLSGEPRTGTGAGSRTSASSGRRSSQPVHYPLEIARSPKRGQQARRPPFRAPSRSITDWRPCPVQEVGSGGWRTYAGGSPRRVPAQPGVGLTRKERRAGGEGFV